MLENLSEQIRNCYQHAEECARKATAQTDPQLKKDFMDLELRWLNLPRSYDFARTAERLLEEHRPAMRRAKSIARNAAILDAARSYFPSWRGCSAVPLSALLSPAVLCGLLS